MLAATFHQFKGIVHPKMKMIP